jgi:hypothetical protein
MLLLCATVGYSTGSAGKVARNVAGEVLLSAWRILLCCSSAEEVERAWKVLYVPNGGMDQTTYMCGIRLFESHSSNRKESSKIRLGRYLIGNSGGL